MRKKDNKKSAFRMQERITAAYLAAMLGIYLLYPGFGGYTIITAQKWNCYVFLTGLYLLAILLLPFALAAVGEGSLRRPVSLWTESTLAQKLIFAYWLCSGISTLLAVDRSIAFWGSGRREGFFAITLYCGSFLAVSRNAKPKKWMLWVLGTAMSFCCILSLIQFAGFNPLNLYPEGMTYYDAYRRYSGEFLGTIGNVDLLSAVFCAAIPCFWIAIVTLKDKRKYLLLIPLLLCLLTLFKAFVAGGVVGTCGSALITVPLLAKEKKRRRLLSLAVLALILAGLCTVYFFGERIGSIAAEAFALMHGHWDDRFGSGRLYIWRETIPLIPERFLFGGGPDTLGLRLDAMFERYDPTLGVTLRATVDVAHNEYLNILVNQGALALGCYLAALVSAAIIWIKNAAHDPIAAICGGAVLSYCIQAFFGISSPISTPFFYLAFAMLCGEKNSGVRCA